MTREEDNMAIAAAESKLNAVRDQAEGFISGFPGVISDYVIDWGNYLVERTVRDKPDLVMELGSEKVSELKSGVNFVMHAMPGLAKASLDEIGWIHRRELSAEEIQDIMASYHLEQDASTKIDDALRDLIGEVAAVLIESGLIDASRDSAWKQRSGRPPRYSYGIPDYGIPHSADLKQARQDYAAIVKDYVEASKTLDGVAKSKKESEAKEFWDRA